MRANLGIETYRSIYADRRRQMQILENLIPNVIEHGGETVCVTVGTLPDGYYLEDDGTGISEAVRDDAFEVTYSTTESGTGFGLTIVKEIAEAHDQDIWATAGSTGGPRFELTGVEFVGD